MKEKSKLDLIEKSKLTAIVSKMPGVPHYPDTKKDFSILESEVVKWICAHPHFQLWIFDKAMDSGMIVFDKSTRLWHGADTDEGRRLRGIAPNPEGMAAAEDCSTAHKNESATMPAVSEPGSPVGPGPGAPADPAAGV